MKTRIWIPALVVCALAVSVGITHDTTVPDTELSAIYGGSACQDYYDCYPGKTGGNCAYWPQYGVCSRSVELTSCLQPAERCADPELCLEYIVDCNDTYIRRDCTRTGPTTCEMIPTATYNCSDAPYYEYKYQCIDL